MSIFDEIEADAQLAERRRVEARIGSQDNGDAARLAGSCKAVDLDDLLDF